MLVIMRQWWVRAERVMAMRISWPPPSRVLPSRWRVGRLGIVNGNMDVFCFGSGLGSG